VKSYPWPFDFTKFNAVSAAKSLSVSSFWPFLLLQYLIVKTAACTDTNVAEGNNLAKSNDYAPFFENPRRVQRSATATDAL
jgi:hypothetical protein